MKAPPIQVGLFCFNFTTSNLEPMSGLTIYKASAGSGKTYKLTGEYLLLLFRNPGLYRNILAVTFTNKATGEMKHRILYELNRLARGEDSGYDAMLQEHLGMDQSRISRQASDILHRILHDYSRFSVSTIDRFFQRVLRTFAREIGLQSGYTLELDEEEILNYVIDDLLLATEEDHQLRQWLVEFAGTRMEEGKSWNFRREIMALARQLTREDVKDLDLPGNDTPEKRKKLADYVARLKAEKARFENQIHSFGKQAVDLIEQNGLGISDFHRGSSGVARYFYYLKEQRMDKLEPNNFVHQVMDNPEKWASPGAKKATRDLAVSLARDKLYDWLHESLDYIHQHQAQYLTVQEILKHIYVLGLLDDIQQRVKNYCKEKNIFLISDAGELLRRIVGNNEAPFIYEKTGSIYHHFMIDEFQDTSRFQWENFRPLVHNSLAQSNFNLVVGDVKQSIYRWRNGDWKILQDEVYREFSRSARTVALDYNWRSREQIVAFNNTIFHYAPGILQQQFNEEISEKGLDNPYAEKLVEAYQDVRQKLPRAHEGGLVVNRFYTHRHGQQRDAREQILGRLIEDIEWMQDQGYALSDMAVMVRRNSEGQKIADALTEKQKQADPQSPYRYDFISNDSLYVMRAESVQLLCALFRHLVVPDDPVNQAFIKETWSRTFREKAPQGGNMHRLFKHDVQSLADYLPKEFVAHQQELRKMPLYELTERLIHIFSVHELHGEIPYIQAFQELVLDFSRRYASDLNSFLQWWEANAHKKTLQLPENYDAIRITTIHKAKGLEFKVVLMPFCNWELSASGSGNKKNYLWCKPEQAPLNKVSVVPVEYSKKLAGTLFFEAYYREQFHQLVDSLNMLYVAFTRAEEVLVSYAPLQEKSDGTLNYLARGPAHTGELLHFIYEQQEHLPKPEAAGAPFIQSLKEYWDPGSMVFFRGEFPSGEEQQAADEEALVQKDYPVYSLKPPLHLKYEHGAFFSGDTDLFRGTIDYGRVMHQVFENIHTLEDIDSALEKVYLEGKISSSERKHLREEILQIIRQNQAQDWFSGKWQVYTEKDMLLPNGRIYRPDRVMFKDGSTVVVDYKFGEKIHEAYRKKMNHYLRELKNMGYERPVGYIWYINQKQMIRVT